MTDYIYFGQEWEWITHIAIHFVWAILYNGSLRDSFVGAVAIESADIINNRLELTDWFFRLIGVILGFGFRKLIEFLTELVHVKYE